MIAPYIERTRPPSERFAPPLPPVIGHRGAAARAPENTLAGLRRAAELGCAWVEFDVRLTADGVPVLCHDPSLERTTDGSGRLSAQTLAAIRDCDAGRRFGAPFAGERVPTLAMALRLAAQLGLGANIEIKAERGRDYATAAAVAAAIAELDDVPLLLLSSFSPAAVATLRRLAPHLPRALLFRLMPRDWEAIAGRLGCVAIGAEHRRLRRPLVSRIGAAGYLLMAYTVNDPGRARRLLEWGVASVFSDTPDIILGAIAGRRVERPPVAVPRRPLAQQGAIR